MKEYYKETKILSDFFEQRAVYFDCTFEEAIEGFKNDYKKGLIKINFENKTIIENYSNNTLSESEFNDILLAIV